MFYAMHSTAGTHAGRLPRDIELDRQNAKYLSLAPYTQPVLFLSQSNSTFSRPISP
jgi:hypothetical protein